MYFKNVNRGLSFTKAGAYTTGLVIVLGLLATSSGSNAFFIALGFGLSLLTISGLLSERMMKFFVFNQMSAVKANAKEPFAFTCSVTNKSASWHLFGVENLFLTEVPRFSLINARLSSVIEARVLALGPGESKQVVGYSPGLPRGFYDHFTVVHRTLFPFGLISKFKLTRTYAQVAILPPVDSAFFERVIGVIEQSLRGIQNEEEFHSHRPMLPRDSWKDVDWKKNAGRPADQWVIKTHQNPNNETPICVRVDWDGVRHLASALDYERALCHVRTALDAVVRAGCVPSLELNSKECIDGYEPSLEFLMRAPAFELRHQLGEAWSGTVLRQAASRVLVIGRGTCEWGNA